MKIDDLLNLLSGLWYVQITDGVNYIQSANIEFLRKKCKEMWPDHIITDLELDDGDLVITIERGAKE